MSRLRSLALAVCALLAAASPLSAQKAGSLPKLKPIVGPTNATLGTVAELAVPEGYVFLDGNSTRALLKAEGEPVSGHELGFLRATNQHWSVFFIFKETGYVKDDDKDKLDANKLLAAIKEGAARGNKERQRNGGSPIEVVGWEIPPKYDSGTHNLEWAIRGISDGQPLLNYNTRLLGRKGVMEVILVVSPENLTQTLPAFRTVLGGCSYHAGQTYAEYRPGDKVAKYGLAALVVGGAAVGAAKFGLFAWAALLFKKAWKLIILAVAAVASFFKKLFRSGARRANE